MKVSEKLKDFLFTKGIETKMNWHEDFIVNIASIVKPKVYVELGLYRCELFNRIIPFADKLIGVDIMAEAGDYMKKSNKTEFYRGTTQAYAAHLKAKPIEIDFLFIDADHSKEAVEHDFNSYFPFVVPHGLILLHDSHPGDGLQKRPEYCGNGYLAIESLSRNTEEYEMMTIPVSPGLTICRKRRTQLSWEEL